MAANLLDLSAPEGHAECKWWELAYTSVDDAVEEITRGGWE